MDVGRVSGIPKMIVKKVPGRSKTTLESESSIYSRVNRMRQVIFSVIQVECEFPTPLIEGGELPSSLFLKNLFKISVVYHQFTISEPWRMVKNISNQRILRIDRILDCSNQINGFMIFKERNYTRDGDSYQ